MLDRKLTFLYNKIIKVKLKEKIKMLKPERLVCEIEKKEKEKFLKKLQQTGHTISFVIRKSINDYIKSN